MTVNKNWTFKTGEFKKSENKNMIKEQRIKMFLHGTVKIVKMAGLSLFVERYVSSLRRSFGLESGCFLGVGILAGLLSQTKKEGGRFSAVLKIWDIYVLWSFVFINVIIVAGNLVCCPVFIRSMTLI